MTRDPYILALDLATRTGFACGRPSDSVPPYSGSRRLASPGASMGAVFKDCRTWLSAFLEAHPVQLIVFEAPHFAPKSNIGTLRTLIGLAAIVEELAYSGGYDVREAAVADVRRHFIGANLKRKAAKEATIDNCYRLGWKPTDDNEADALALWHYQASFFDPKLALQTSPLFRRRVA
jgi:hypothetical protein